VSEDSLERWRAVPDYEGYYEVSDQGRLRSLRYTPPRILRGGTDRCGYNRFTLTRQGSQKTASIHGLVMLAFVGPLPEGMEVRHRNGDPSDNRLANLVYGTHLENMRDKYVHGTAIDQNEVCKNGHPQTPENVQMDRQGPDRQWLRRRCLPCEDMHRQAAADQIRARKRARRRGISTARQVDCRICATEFTTTVRAFYCSDSCRDEGRRRRRRQVWRARNESLAVSA
jgi:hypothetical protein